MGEMGSHTLRKILGRRNNQRGLKTTDRNLVNQKISQRETSGTDECDSAKQIFLGQKHSSKNCCSILRPPSPHCARDAIALPSPSMPPPPARCRRQPDLACQNRYVAASTGVLYPEIMEEWGFFEERELQGWKGGVVCMTCQHFTYGVDQHCHTLVGCNLRKKQLQQGEHLKKRCKLWASTWQTQVGWAPESS